MDGWISMDTRRNQPPPDAGSRLSHDSSQTPSAFFSNLFANGIKRNRFPSSKHDASLNQYFTRQAERGRTMLSFD
jgi:hypothetical protein